LDFLVPFLRLEKHSSALPTHLCRMGTGVDFVFVLVFLFDGCWEATVLVL
jgi:hypothetical protein